MKKETKGEDEGGSFTFSPVFPRLNAIFVENHLK